MCLKVTFIFRLAPGCIADWIAAFLVGGPIAVAGHLARRQHGTSRADKGPSPIQLYDKNINSLQSGIRMEDKVGVIGLVRWARHGALAAPCRLPGHVWTRGPAWPKLRG